MINAPLKVAALAIGTLLFAGAASAMPLAPAAHTPTGLEKFEGAVEPVHYRRRYARRHAYYPRYRYRYGYRPRYYSYGYAPYYYGGYPYGYPYGYGFGPSVGFSFRFR
jgi:hypothetical protein